MVLCFVLCLRDSGGCLVVVLSLLRWLSTSFRNGQRWFPNSEEGFLQMRSRSMGERSGRANSDQNRMCGRGGIAGDVTLTSRRGCKGSTGRRSLQSQESGLQGSSASSGEEDRTTRSLEAANKELRARIDATEKKEGVARRAEYPFPSKGGGGFGRCVVRIHGSRR